MDMMSNNEKILICGFDKRVEIVKHEGVTVVWNSLFCLNEATIADYGLVIFDFTVGLNSLVRSEIIDLCRCLKINPMTRETPLFASIDRWHRKIAEQMKDAGLDYMGVRKYPERIDPRYISELIRTTKISVRIDNVVSRLCPFMNYERIDDRSELILCGAWRNRMVLGGKRLHDLCETGNHLHCDYFLNPVTVP